MGSSGIPLEEIKEVMARWTEPHRHYHNMRHLLSMVTDLETMAGLYGFSRDERTECWLTAVYHDAVYEIGKPSGWNEEESAALARGNRSIGRDLALRVSDNILLTINHLNPKTMVQACVLDADLAGLGRNYWENGANIRAEYPDATEEQWFHGRVAFLNKMLDRPTLYYTSWGRKYEAPARASMEADIATCQAALGLL